MAADPTKTFSQVSGDGAAAPFVQFTLRIPGAFTVPFSVSGAIQGPLTVAGGLPNVSGTMYTFATAALGTIGPSTTTAWASFQAQIVGGTVSMLTSTVAYPAVAAGYVEFARMNVVGDTSPAAATIWSSVTQW